MRAALILAAVLTAGAAQAQEADPAPRWMGAVEKTEAHLTYAVPESDEVELSLNCTRKTGQIRIFFPVEERLAETLRGSTWLDKVGRPAPWPVSVTVASGAQSTTVRGEAHPDELAGGSSISVELTDRAPVMQAFAKTGELRVSALGTTVAVPPAPRRDASRLVRACR
ncbi:hypothetical protein ACFODL_03385 [Phenylobacterium terrae]|uniref:Uncharacterized protein n=1 Tax=Phenylobacterium terrae TaxID=2665495 RepID=A0ABW4MWA1_9CAUL